MRVCVRRAVRVCVGAGRASRRALGRDIGRADQLTRLSIAGRHFLFVLYEFFMEQPGCRRS